MTEEKLNLGRTFKLGLFHLGSALSDILVSGVWNRVLITELAINATPVAFLTALRYLIAPLSLWAGHRSDTHPLFGKRRLPYIYIGRLLMWLALPLLPLVLVELGRDTASLSGWLLALVVFIFYGIGNLLSGAPFLALVRESAPPTRRGIAVVIVETFLLAGFAIVPITYSVLMDDYTIEGFWQLVGLATIGGALAWGVSVWGEERPKAEIAALSPAEREVPFGAIVRTVLGQANTRYFFATLGAGAIALFAQDAILEPLGGDLFGLDVGQTTRFSAYYGTGVLLTLIIGILLTRRWLPQQHVRVTFTGLVALIATLGLLAYTALTLNQSLLTPALFLFGVASGLYTVGGLSLMVAMTDERHAGLYLGIWSVAQLVFRGIGVTMGGAVLDTVRAVTENDRWAYAAVFIIEAGAALLAILFLTQVVRIGFLYTPQRAVPPEMVAVAAD